MLPVSSISTQQSAVKPVVLATVRVKSPTVQLAVNVVAVEDLLPRKVNSPLSVAGALPATIVAPFSPYSVQLTGQIVSPVTHSPERK